jgi:hypothetical protein
MITYRQFLYVGIALAILAGVLMEGSFGYVIILICLGVYVIPPIAAVTGIIYFIRKKHAGIGRLLKMQATLLPLLVVSYFAGLGMHRWIEWRIHDYVTAAVPVLDAHKARTGAFPVTLEEVGLPRPPEWLTDGYHSDGASFRFHYEDPAEMMGGYSFENIERRWYHWS